MSIFFRRGTPEVRGSFQQVWGSGGESPLHASSVEKALAVVPVYAATSFIADQLAATPWAVFRERGGLPEKVARQPRLVTDPGSGVPDLFGWKHQLCTSLLLWGNAYGVVVASDGGGVAQRVVWLRPDMVDVDESGPEPTYKYQGKRVPGRMIHIPWYTLPGSVVGLSPLGLFRTQIETGLEAQRVGKNQFKRGLAPAGILKNTAKTLDQTQADTARKRFVASVSTSEPFVTGNDWDYAPLQMPQTDVNFITGAQLTATQIAAIYRIAPEIIGGKAGGDSLTYKNLEQDQIRFNMVTLRPVAARVESAVSRELPQPQYVRFNLDASVRADLKTRYEAHSIALGGKPFKDVDEVRELEEMPPLTGEQRANMVGGTDA